ncbi:MAG TPA: glucose-6-phosphate isomerase [Anaerolineaceae bacterium]|nr:glucose-6-phosphate isomerase [Anaerolineaceae bacterium]
MDQPFTFTLPFPDLVPSRVDNHIQRRLSAMRGQFLDQKAYEEMVAAGDPLLYEVYEIHRPEVEGEMLMGISVVHPGKVGDEFYMTKGHFHTVLDTAEVYYVLKGEGCMVMETPEGDAHVEMLSPGKVLYVPPRWAHRSVCTGRQEDLVTFFIYPGNAGHDYGTIEQQGFRKLVVEKDGRVAVVDNPRWQPAQKEAA